MSGAPITPGGQQACSAAEAAVDALDTGDLATFTAAAGTSADAGSTAEEAELNDLAMALDDVLTSTSSPQDTTEAGADLLFEILNVCALYG